MDAVPQQLVGAGVGSPVAGLGWLWLTPVAPERASYSGAIVFLGLLLVIPAVYLLLHIRPGAIHRVPIWDCGFEKLTPRMQYTATSFAMPIRRIFGFLFAIREQVRRDPHPGAVAPTRGGCGTRCACATGSGAGSTSPSPTPASCWRARSAACSRGASRRT